MCQSYFIFLLNTKLFKLILCICVCYTRQSPFQRILKYDWQNLMSIKSIIWTV